MTNGKFNPRRRRPHACPLVKGHQRGKRVEVRFFKIIEEHHAGLLPAIAEVLPTTREMDVRGHTDAVVVMRDSMRFYINLKSSEHWLSVRDHDDLSIPFVLDAKESGKSVIERLNALMALQYAATVGCHIHHAVTEIRERKHAQFVAHAVLLLRRLAARHAVPLLQAAE